MNIINTANQLAEYTASGDEFLANLQHAQSSIPPRKYKGDDLREILGGLSTTTIYKRLKELLEAAGKPVVEGERKMGCTIEEVMMLQDYFGVSPRRADTDEPVTVAFTNFKGGCWKTTTCWYAASYFASRGYRVLCVDLDPQASLTENLGFLPDAQVKDEDTLANYIVGFEGFDIDDVGRTIIDTHLPNLKLIPGCLGLASAEYDLIAEMARANERQEHEVLRNSFFHVKQLINKVKGDFDIVLLDGSPSLGILPLNIVFAADVVVVPVPTEPTDFSSTKTFCRLIGQEMATIAEFFPDIETPQMAFLPTRYGATATATHSSEMILQLIRETFGAAALQSYIRKHESVVSNLSAHRRTIFDVNAGTVSSELGAITIHAQARERAMKNFSEAFDEILEKLIIPRWASKQINDEGDNT